MAAGAMSTGISPVAAEPDGGAYECVGWTGRAVTYLMLAAALLPVPKRRRQFHGNHLPIFDGTYTGELDYPSHSSLQLTLEDNLVAWNYGPTKTASV